MPRPTTDEHDDHDEEQAEARPGRKPKPDAGGGGGTGVKVLLILGAVALGVLLLCGGVGLLVALRLSGISLGADWAPIQQKQAQEQWEQRDAAARSDQEHAKVFLDYWLELIRLNSLDEAYRLTSAAYQARTSRTEFHQCVQNNADLKTPAPGWSYGLDGKPGTRFTFLLSRPKNSPYWLTVAREGTGWKLDEIAAKFDSCTLRGRGEG